jgi:PPM family protein phosphatase
MIQVNSHTEAGGHAHNEDAFDVAPHPSDPDCLLCALADGQGGRAGGARAAQQACRVCIEAASVRQPAILATRPGAWEEILRQADAAVSNDHEAGFTTLIAFSMQKEFICGASSGDSGVYAVSAGEPGAILTEQQHKNPPIGSGGARPVGFMARLEQPWTVLALSDGVWKYAGWDRIADAASLLSGKEILDMLRKQASLPGSGRLQDDFTVVAFQADGSSASA